MMTISIFETTFFNTDSQNKTFTLSTNLDYEICSLCICVPENNVNGPGRAEQLRNQSETCYCFLASSGATSCSTTTSAAATATEWWEVPQELRKRGRRTGRAVVSSTHSTHIHLQRTMLFTLLHKPTCLCCLQPIIKRSGNQGVFYYYTLLRWKIPSSLLLCV